MTRTTLSRTDMISQMEGLSFYGLFPVLTLCAEDNRLLISSDFNQVWAAHHMSHTSISQDLCVRVPCIYVCYCAVKSQTVIINDNFTIANLCLVCLDVYV